MRPKYFTVAEADALVPRLKYLFNRLALARRRILVRQPQIQGVLAKVHLNSGSREASEMVRDFEIIESIAKEINGMGVSLKGIDKGLVDFLHRRDGRDVYLCWMYGEDHVTYWHDLETGFKGRQALE